MSYRYRCSACRLTSPRLDRHGAHQMRAAHRAQFHGGMVPDGEQLVTDTGLSLPARRLLVGLAVGGTVLAVANWLTR